MEAKVENIFGSGFLNCFVVKSSFPPTDGLESFGAVLFAFEAGGLELRPLPDTDELSLSFINKPLLHAANNDFQQYQIGQRDWKFQMYWRCQNANGYDDMIVLGFQDLHPNLIILSEGSSLKFFEASKFRQK